jgi:YegS/Rv2252/BmrU family lipid kinase
LPLGTGNTFARSLGIPVDLASAVQTIATGRVQNIDVGQVNQQVFLNSVSLGLSVEIAGALTHEMKDKLGLLAWPVVAGKVFLTHRPIALKLTDGERKLTLRTHQLLVVNGRYVAGPIIASPDASVQDSRLTVFTLGGARKSQLIRVALKWLSNRHMDSPAARYFETKSLRVESRRRLVANVDGDLNEHTPLEIKVLSRALRVVVPHDFKADEA